MPRAGARDADAPRVSGPDAGTPDATTAKAGSADAGLLRVGYAEARPWAYRMGRDLRGLDVAAMEDVAMLLSRTVAFTPCLHADLHAGLMAGRFDIAIGGLLAPRARDVLSIPVRHFVRERPVGTLAAPAATSPQRLVRVHFPNVWWVRRGRGAFAAALRLALLRRRLALVLLQRGVIAL